MKLLFTCLLILGTGLRIYAQDADKVLGIWLNGEGTGKIQIFKTTSGHYAGKIIWLKEPNDPDTGKSKLDKHNSDKSLRNVAVNGLVNMSAFEYDADDQVWEHGKIYDPKNGKEYSCKMELADINTLKVRGYIGISLLGRTDTWTREVKK